MNILDRPPSGWFGLDVMRCEARKWDWYALMVDVPPDELRHCRCKTAFVYVHPSDYKPEGTPAAQEALVRIPGKHRNEDDAWEAFEESDRGTASDDARGLVCHAQLEKRLLLRRAFPPST